jgi:hypothetical protein
MAFLGADLQPCIPTTAVYHSPDTRNPPAPWSHRERWLARESAIRRDHDGRLRSAEAHERINATQAIEMDVAALPQGDGSPIADRWEQSARPLGDGRLVENPRRDLDSYKFSERRQGRIAPSFRRSRPTLGCSR